ncbi:MAG: amidohydrolase family protein [Acidobacteria bacterium]|nr:amidohydrolase family protein [Acidobacteriota bacterium]
MKTMHSNTGSLNMYTKIKTTLLFILLFSISTLAQNSVRSGYQKTPHGENKIFKSGILVENARIIDPDQPEIKVFTGYIVIQDQTIAYVGKRKPAVSNEVQRIDGTGKYVIPGLIDSHVHLANIAGFNGKYKRKYPELAASYFRQLPKSYLYFGYTTLIDLNNYSPKTIDSILKEKIRPGILTCGEQLEVMNGFMMAEVEPKDRLAEYPYFVHDAYNKNAILPASVSPAEHTPKAAVQRVVKKQNGKCIKLAFENGFGGTEEVTWEMPTREIVRDIVREARKEDLPVLLHASSFEAQQFAYDTDVDIIAHGMWHWGLLKDYLNVRELPETHRSLLRKIAKKGLGYQPTFRVIAGQRDVFDDEFINDKKLELVYPKEFLKWLKTDEGRWQQNNIKKYAKGAFDGRSNREIAEFMQLIVDKIGISTNFLAGQNANLLFGTDTPSSNAHTNPPGYNGYLEMQEWHKAGVSLEMILKAATINNARAFHLQRSHGSIKKGKIANLLLLDANPLKDISAYDSISSVIINGKVFRRNSFSALADEL